MIWPVAAPPTSELIAFVRVPNISAISFSPAVRASRSIKKGDRQIYPKLFRFFLLFDWLLETYPKTTTITFHPCHLLFLLVIRVFLVFIFFCDLSLPQPNCFLFLFTCSPPHLYNLGPGLFRLALLFFLPTFSLFILQFPLAQHPILWEADPYPPSPPLFTIDRPAQYPIPYLLPPTHQGACPTRHVANS